MVNDSQHQDSIDLQLRRVRVDDLSLVPFKSLRLFLRSLWPFRPPPSPFTGRFFLLRSPTPSYGGWKSCFRAVMSPGFRPCHDYHDASPYGQACARYSIVPLPSESFSVVVSPEPMGEHRGQTKRGSEGQRVFALGLSVTLFPFLLWFGLSQLFRRLGRSCFLPGSHTEHAQDGVKNRVVPSLVVNCCFGRGPDLSVPLSRGWDIGGFGCVRKLHPFPIVPRSGNFAPEGSPFATWIASVSQAYVESHEISLISHVVTSSQRPSQYS